MRERRRGVRGRVGACALVAVALLSGACTQDDGAVASDAPTSTASSADPSSTEPDAGTALPAPVQELTFDATEYTFEISPDPSDGLEPGWTLVKFRNVGAEPHQVMFAQIKDGVDLSELAAAGAGDSSGAGAIEFVDMIGGISYIGAGHDTTALVDLREGTVMAMCYVPDANGVAHALMGMSTALTVSAPSDAAATTLPATDTGDDEVVGAIELSDEGYQLPDEMVSGWYHVDNTDSELHELALLRLGEPLDDDQVARLVDDLAANATPQVELEALGGMGAISAGFDGYVYLDLAPGDYLAVDFMPDPGEPRPHMLDGYYGTFSI